MTEQIPPLLAVWTRYAVEVAHQSPLEMTDDMLAFMAGASHVVQMLTEAAEENNDVTALFNTLQGEVADFAAFVVSTHAQAEAAE